MFAFLVEFFWNRAAHTAHTAQWQLFWDRQRKFSAADVHDGGTRLPEALTAITSCSVSAQERNGFGGLKLQFGSDKKVRRPNPDGTGNPQSARFGLYERSSSFSRVIDCTSSDGHTTFIITDP